MCQYFLQGLAGYTDDSGPPSLARISKFQTEIQMGSTWMFGSYFRACMLQHEHQLQMTPANFLLVPVLVMITPPFYAYLYRPRHLSLFLIWCPMSGELGLGPKKITTQYLNMAQILLL